MQTVQRGLGVYNALLFDEKEIIAPTNIPNGRNPQLIAARDNFLLHRFYFKSKIQRKIYTDTLEELQNEVYLSKLMIQKIIQAKSDNVLMIKKQQPSIKVLREVWPHVTW